MAATLLFTPSQIRDVVEPKNPTVLHLQETTELMRLVEQTVEQEWTELPMEAQVFLKAFAYRHHPPMQFSFRMLWFAAVTAYLFYKRNPALEEFIAASQSLRSTILSAIERSNPVFQTRLAQEVDQMMSEIESIPVFEGDISEWLKETRAQDLKSVPR
jgi:hypothetical protein